MRVQTEEWRRFIPGVRMYKGKKTLFYNGEKLRDEDLQEFLPLIYDYEERKSWEVIIILPGVEIIPDNTFNSCYKVKTVIMNDTVKRIEYDAFACCGIVFVKLSTNLEFIGNSAFFGCRSLTSIFIPPSCAEIGTAAFGYCMKLTIFGLPQHTQLGQGIFETTALIKKSPLELDEYGGYENKDEEAVQWIKSINNEEAYALHRTCTSFNPLFEIVYATVKRQGLQAMRVPNAIGITPSQYLAANTFADISEKEIINKYILEMMGEV